jgi:glycosyltransferase involved in cell wall biosynthesis
MPAPAVSIIMPAFNRERYLAESIESVLNQTFSDWELIVVDDGSSDSTPAIIAEVVADVHLIEECRLHQRQNEQDEQRDQCSRYQRLGARRHRLGHDAFGYAYDGPPSPGWPSEPRGRGEIAAER